MQAKKTACDVIFSFFITLLLNFSNLTFEEHYRIENLSCFVLGMEKTEKLVLLGLYWRKGGEGNLCPDYPPILALYKPSFTFSLISKYFWGYTSAITIHINTYQWLGFWEQWYSSDNSYYNARISLYPFIRYYCLLIGVHWNFDALYHKYS